MMKLSKLSIFQKATITAIQADQPIKERLQAMGLVKNEEVQMLKFTLAHNTYEVMVGNSRVALRAEEAACVEVTQ